MFVNELDLQNKFIFHLKKSIKDNEYIADEFNARFGNVDIIKVRNFESLKITKKQALILSNISSSRIIGYLHKSSPRKLEYLMKNTGYNMQYLLSIISKLKSADLITECEKRKYVINPQFQFPRLIFTSYEAKLTDWKKAISQSLKNKSFSSESYVVMPEDFAIKLFDKYHDYFVEYNVGLIAVSNTKNTTLLKPKVHTNKESILPVFICSIAKYYLRKEQIS